MGLSAVTEKITIGAPVDKVFQFVTDTDQAPRILPAALHAAVLHRNTRRLGPGASLEVAVRPRGIAFRAEVSVTAWRLNRHLAYAWRSGPFHPWEHDLWFESLSSTHCRVTHCLIYRPPWGLLGLALDRVWFRHALRRALHRLGPSWAAARDFSPAAASNGLVSG